MNLFNRKTGVIKPKFTNSVVGKSTPIDKKLMRRKLIDLAEKTAKENPQYAGLLKEAKKQGKLSEAVNAILSGKLKVRSVKPEPRFYHGALPEKAKKLKQEGLEAKGIREYRKKEGYNPKENAAIYVFGKVPEEYVYKGRVFSKEFEEGMNQVRTTKAPAEQAMNYPEEKLYRINRERKMKGLPTKEMNEYEPALVTGKAKELAKKGIGFAVDPEITGRTKSYILVDMKTGRPISKLDPRLMNTISADKEGVMKKAKEKARRALKQGKESYEQSPQRNFMSKEEYEEYMLPSLERKFYKQEFEKQMRRGLDEEAIKDVVLSESEKAVEEALKKEVPKRKRKGLLEQLFG